MHLLNVLLIILWQVPEPPPAPLWTMPRFRDAKPVLATFRYMSVGV